MYLMQILINLDYEMIRELFANDDSKVTFLMSYEVLLGSQSDAIP